MIQRAVGGNRKEASVSGAACFRCVSRWPRGHRYSVASTISLSSGIDSVEHDQWRAPTPCTRGLPMIVLSRAATRLLTFRNVASREASTRMPGVRSVVHTVTEEALPAHMLPLSPTRTTANKAHDGPEHESAVPWFRLRVISNRWS